jgi:uncharacterized protein (UPF0332 family)
MIKQINLKKLYRLGILRLVELSVNLKDSYLEKSKSSLLSSKILCENNQYNDSITLSYFSMYNSCLALFYFCGIKCENHNAIIFLLKYLFNLENEDIIKSKKERKDKQYYPNLEILKQEVLQAITEEFNSMVFNFLNKLNNSQIDLYRNKLLGELKCVE